MHRTGLWATVLCIACGGTVITPTEEDPETNPSVEPSSDAGAAGDAGWHQVPLGACEEGFDPTENPDRLCNWLGEDGRCYDSRPEACNCICPSDRDSVCSSGFYQGEGEATPVACF